MKARWMIVAALAVGVSGFLLGRAGVHSDLPGDGKPGAGASEGEREVLYWVAPMDPNFRRDKPGKSPMGMDLVPVYADEVAEDEGVRISPAVENNLGVRTAVAEVRPLWRKIEATGYVDFDETRISHLHLRTEGWIVRLAVKADGERVKAGDLLFELYSPELVNAQKEYLQAARRNEARLVRAAGEKLRALGMTPGQVEELAAQGEARDRVRILAPQDGVVFDLAVREGMFVQPNTTVLSLADLSSVWMQAEVFESQAGWVAVGQAAEARLDYLPGQVITGQVDFVYPVLEPETRTLRVRLRFDNPGERLKPNMYAQVSIFGKLRPSALSIPREALIRAPGRDRVVVSVGKGRFHVHEVLTGMESEDWVEIRAGIEAGDRVVTSAQFLIDSEASLAGSIRRLESVPGEDAESLAESVYASGQLDAVDSDRRRLRVTHGPIEALGWPSMTMEFELDPGVDLAGLKAGQNIQFALRQEHAGHWVINRLGGEPELQSADPADLAGREAQAAATPARYGGQGTVKGVDPAQRLLHVAHGPIQALDWPGMSMNFAVDESVDLAPVKAGSEIHFMLRRQVDGTFVIDEIHVLDAAPAMEGHHHHD